MIASIVLAWLHYVFVMFLAGGATTEMYLLRLPPSDAVIRTLVRADRFYGIGAVLVLVTGLARIPVGHGGKGWAFYAHSGAFHGALGLFILAALLSLVPTLRFMRYRRALAEGQLPHVGDWSRLRLLVHLQMGLMVLVALAMPMMARGY